MFEDIVVSVCPQYIVKTMRKKPHTEQLKDPFSRLEVINLINIISIIAKLM